VISKKNWNNTNSVPAWNNFDEGRVVCTSTGVCFYENQIKDHPGSVRVAYEKDASGLLVRQVNSYYPYGMNITSLSGEPVNIRASGNEYLYNGKMFQDELGLDWLDYGARFYDAVVGRWWSVDPKAEKYPNWSPYSYCYDNPLIFIDPDGQEGIVVSGQPGDHKNEEHFLVNGLDRAKTLQKQYKKEGNGEKATWFVYNSGGEGGYSKETIVKYQKLADKAGITMTVVSDADQIVDYVNDKTGGDSRANDLITNFTYVGHATPGDLDIGFEDHGTWNMMTNETLDVSDFNKEAFSKENSNANLVGGCKTAVKGDLPFERSVAEQMADKVSGTVKASSVRVYYPGGVVSDQQLVKKNNGIIVVIQGRNK
jgi:RHS repeat-associated protein